MVLENAFSRLSPMLRRARGVLRQSLIFGILALAISAPVHAQTIGDSTNGAAIYLSAKCAGCHDRPPTATDGSLVYYGVDWGRIKAAISNTVNAAYPGLPYRSGVGGDMAKYAAGGASALTDAQLKDISAYICSTLGSSASTCNSAVVITPAIASVAPTSVAFGNVQVGTASAGKVISVSNTGGSPLLISGFSFTGASPGSFSQTNNCPASLPANTGQCTVIVIFSPTSASALTANLQVSHNAAGGFSAVALNGAGTPAPAPVIALDKTSLVFGSTLVGQSAAPQAVLLSNIGNAPLLLPAQPFSLSGANGLEFSVAHNCPTTLAAGANCSASVAYTPTSAGLNKTAAMGIANNSGLSPVVVTLGASAANPTPALQTSLASLAFGTQPVGSNTSLSLNVLNNGTGDLVFTSAPFVIASSPFTQVNNCPAALAVNAQCAVTVTFTAAAAGVLNSTLTVNSNVSPAKVVTLVATAVAVVTNVPQISLAPVSLVFAAGTINTQSPAQTLTLSNPGKAPLNVSSVVISGVNAADYALGTAAGSCGAAFTVAAGASCELLVVFTPLAAGASSGQVSVVSDSAGGVSSVSVSGTGLAAPAPVVVVNTTLLSFGGGQVAGSSSVSRTVTYTNAGTAVLTGSVQVTGGSAGDFVVVSGAGSCLATGFSLAPAASCAVYLQYRPQATGTSSASLTLASNAALSPAVVLAGTAGAAPAPVANLVGSGAWPVVALNQASQTKTFVLSNDGNAALLPGVMRITGAAAADFSMASGCPASLAPAQTCTVAVGFTARQAGVRNAVLEVLTNASAQALTVDLVGTGSVGGVTVVDTSAPSGVSVQAPGVQSAKGGGCTTGNVQSGLLDPTLWLLCLASAIILLHRRFRSPRSQAARSH